MRHYLIGLPILLVVLGVVFYSIQKTETPSVHIVSESIVEKSEITFTETEYDFGVVKQSAGLISYDFSFVYTGDIERKVVGVPTSCGCTTAEINVDTLISGEGGIITVTFDPNLHAEPEGRFFKSIEILTEPPLEKNESLKIWVEIDLDLGLAAYKEIEHEDEDEHEDGRAYHSLSPKELEKQLPEKDFFLVDVHIPEQTHIYSTDAIIPYNELEENASKLPEDKDAKIVLYCRSGSMSRAAAQSLIDMGYTNVWDLEGGINAFNAL